jgi:hypothetical protein
MSLSSTLWETPPQLASLPRKISKGICLIFIFYRNGYAEFVNIKTDYIELKSKQRDGKLNKKAKLFITLKKAENFDAKMEEFNQIKEKRQAEAEEKKKAEEPKADEKVEEEAK